MGSEFRPLNLDGVYVIPLGDDIYYLGSPTLGIKGVFLPDGVLYNQTTVLNANTAVTNITGATVVGQALAANSIVLSGTVASGDIAFYGLLGTASQQFLFYDTSATQGFLRGSWLIGTGALPAPDSLLHVWSGSAGAITANPNTLITIENWTDTFINFLTPNVSQGGILVGDPESALSGAFLYRHTTNDWRVDANTVTQFLIGDGTLTFQKATTISSTAGLTLTSGGLFRVNLNTAQDMYFFGGSVGAGRTLGLMAIDASGASQVQSTPSIRMGASYTTGASVCTYWDALISHTMITGGATPKSQLILGIGATGGTTAAFAMENNNGVITNYSYGTLVMSNNIKFIGNVGLINSADNAFLSLRGSTAAYGFGALIELYGKTHGNAGRMDFSTPNAASDGDVARLIISGNLATAVATWSNVTHSGFNSSGDATFSAKINVQDAVQFWNACYMYPAGTTAAEYYSFKARDVDGAAYVEVARAENANDPFFSMGGSQQFKFYNSGAADLVPASGSAVSVGVSANFKRFYAEITLATDADFTAIGLTPNAVILSAAIRVSVQITGLDSADHHISLGNSVALNLYCDAAQGGAATTIDVNKKGKFTFCTAGVNQEALALRLTISGGGDNIPSAGKCYVEVIYLDSSNLADV
jgi:hypothetical protein